MNIPMSKEVCCLIGGAAGGSIFIDVGLGSILGSGSVQAVGMPLLPSPSSFGTHCLYLHLLSSSCVCPDFKCMMYLVSCLDLLVVLVRR